MASLERLGDQEVTISEQGDLKIDTETDAGVASPYDMDHTVPVGKRWLLKNIEYSTGSGLTTIGYRIVTGGATVLIYKNASSPPLSGSVNVDNGIILNAGDIVRQQTISGGSLNITSKILILEQDA